MSGKKIVIVTGATSGFGKIFAELADERFQKLDEFWLIGRNKENLMSLSDRLQHKTKIFPYDLKDMESLINLRQQLKRERPTVKYLVNAAGFGIVGHVEGQEPEELAEMIDVNCRALTYLTRATLPFMTKNSRIMNFASVAAFMPQPSFAVYAATKAYVLSFTRALNQELKRKGIYALAVCPGPAATNFFDQAQNRGKEKAGAYKDLFLVQPKPVVEKALRDSMLKKEVSVYSLPMKSLHLLTKIIPRKYIFGFLK